MDEGKQRKIKRDLETIFNEIGKLLKINGR